MLNETTAIEVKGRSTVGRRDLKGLLALREEGLLRDYIVVCLEERPRLVDGVQILPWGAFLECLWDGSFD
ncbi:MAG: hypothetical protein HN348_35990 [Proteobacteria bacterium]|nr:hypothetical protein [Pseudomonadota bacterium]